MGDLYADGGASNINRTEGSIIRAETLGLANYERSVVVAMTQAGDGMRNSDELLLVPKALGATVRGTARRMTAADIIARLMTNFSHLPLNKWNYSDNVRGTMSFSPTDNWIRDR